ncbi:MAG: type I polyketide synthase, partial [Thermoleophilia bacterium]
MTELTSPPIAVVGISAIMPNAPTGPQFWSNIREGRYGITDVPPERWDPDLYYDPDPEAPGKTYSRIGGWVREFVWEPRAWRLPLPPTVAAQMDPGQQWSVSAAQAALVDAGWPDWGVDPERVAVILGNALGGQKHYDTTMRIQFPESARDLGRAPSFAALPADVRATILEEWHQQCMAHSPEINEGTMPGELANIMAGRVSNLFNFRGPNFITDAACASALAAMSSAVAGLGAGHYDAVITGGVDRNMGVNAFVKFCKIGALSATGTRPFDAGADGFVMGEGAALFVLKRLADAERAGDRIYAVLLGLGGSSDGKGKGITAPNPVGQRLSVERAWANSGLDPATMGLVEAHGTSTRVGDGVELGCLTEVLVKAGAAPGTVALGSVKSNIGHLKAAAGAAGFFKAVMALHEKVLPPSLHFQDPNPNVDWDESPLRVNTELREWPQSSAGVRRAGVSAFGFGGTNFHAVLEEYVPGRHGEQEAPRTFASAPVPRSSVTAPTSAGTATPTGSPRPPLRGALVVGGVDDADVVAQLERAAADAATGWTPPLAAPDPALAGAEVRVAIDHSDAADLAAKAGKAVAAFRSGAPAMWKMLRAQGVFVGRGPAPKVAFLYTGQGSQYVNMLKGLRASEPIVAETFAEADRIMTPLLGRSLSSYIFIDAEDPAAVQALEQQLLQTEITQPAVLATDLAMTRVLNAYGVHPDMVMGHSLGEYGALVAAGALTFDSALEAVSARGHEMASLSLDDNGAMAAVFGPLVEIERIVDSVEGNVVIANINSNSQAVIGGATAAVMSTIEALEAAGISVARIPVSHAFHTSIVAPASEPLKVALRRLEVRAPVLPIVANVTGNFYPADTDTEGMLDILGRQVASPVQFVRGLNTLYDAGARVFVEVGPKKALHGFVEDVLGATHEDVLALFTNHPKNGDVPSLNAALCGLWASGLGYASAPAASLPTAPPVDLSPTVTTHPAPATPAAAAAAPTTTLNATGSIPMTTEAYAELGRLFSNVLEQ